MAENRTRSSPTKKTAKKTTSKKTSAPGDDTAKKTTRKTTATKAADSSADQNGSRTSKKTAKASAASRPARTSDRSSRSQPRAAEVMASAVEQLRLLLGHGVESVTAIQRDDDGWQVEVEVLELERVPQTTDVMAGYEVQLDESGELMGYRRVRRYVRGSTEGG